jgi:hypothetical protein
MLGAVDVNWDELVQAGSCPVVSSDVIGIESLGFCTY